MIPQHSTNLAKARLTSEIGRDRVLSSWYDRTMWIVAVIYRVIVCHGRGHRLRQTGYRSSQTVGLVGRVDVPTDYPVNGAVEGLLDLGYSADRPARCPVQSSIDATV